MPIHDWSQVGPGIFHDFHHEWISQIKHALNTGLLPPDYYALAEQITGAFSPDVLTLENVPGQGTTDRGSQSETGGQAGHGGVVLATAPPRVRFTATAKVDQYAAKRNRIAIRHSSGDQIVAMLEIVSPGNKSSRHALRAFVDKANELLAAGIHLLIIDLFPPGPRDPHGIHGAIWSEITEDGFRLPPDQPLTLVAYSAGAVKRAFIEPTAVGTELVDMPLFLEPERYVLVPLEASYAQAFAAVPQRWRKELRMQR